MTIPSWWAAVKYFRPDEFACKCNACVASKAIPPMDEMFVLRLDALRDSYGFPLVVTSGYRCPAHNSAVSTTGSAGPHTTGKAVDVSVYGARAHQLVKLAFEFGFTGIGLDQKGSHASRFVHLDVLTNTNNRPALWTY